MTSNGEYIFYLFTVRIVIFKIIYIRNEMSCNPVDVKGLLILRLQQQFL